MSRVRVVVCAAVFTVTGAGLTGCIDIGPEPVKSKPPSGVPTDVPAKKGELPDGFPLPPGAKKGDFAQTEGTTAGEVTVKDGGEAYDFWVDRLPAKGYSVTNKQNVEIGDAGGSFIEFKGNGYRTGKIAIADKTATITLQRRK